MRIDRMKVAVFYYTQSGQALNVAKSICRDMKACVVYKRIVPLQAYPFPWNKNEFFDVFPEARLGYPPSGIENMDLTDVEDADLIIVVGQSWFLSPSLPLQSFFADKQIKEYLRERNVVFVNACRNMWLMTSRRIKVYLEATHANFAGHIVMQDDRPNLISALTVIRWLMYGKKEASWLFPDAGISDEDISTGCRFGDIIQRTWNDGDLIHLQANLLSAGAIKYKPSVLFLEKIGYRMFGLWAVFIRKKGGLGDICRRKRINMFYCYLLFVLFLVSPFGQILFYLTYPFHQVNRNKQMDCNL